MSPLVLKSPAEIEIMNEANAIIRRILDSVGPRIAPGVTTMQIDAWAEEQIRAAGAVPAFKGYPHPNSGESFPGTICASINDEIVHGIPSPQAVLKEGDIISIDMGVKHKGYYGDSAATFPVGSISNDTSRLLQVTKEALDLGVDQARVGNRVSDIGHVVQNHVEANGFSVVREFVGHGIGSELHEEPQVPNFGLPGRRERLVAGMVLAIEPMVAAGSAEVVFAKDGWTARTSDSSLSAHFEACIAITESGPQVLGRTAES